MHNRLRLAMVVATSIVLFASPVSAHSGYHHNGAQTTTRYDGAYAYIEVNNTGVRPNTFDFVANRIMLKNSTDSIWLEAGWAEVGWTGLVGGSPQQYVYVYDAYYDEWFFYDDLCTSSGCHIDVRIIQAASCDLGDPSCIWRAQLFNHSTGSWETLHSVTLGMDRGYIEEMTEVHIASPFVSHFSVDAANDQDWFLTQRRFSDNTWHNWANSNSVAGAVAPYCIDWITLYSRFEAQNGGC
jgi:hypothetical protein